MKRAIIILFILGLAVACAKREARRPVMVKTDTFLKESAKKNRELLEDQEAVMDSIIACDTLHSYLSSKDGFKYYYISENASADPLPKFGDRVEFTYSLSDIYGKEIYSKEDTKVITYYVDKQELFQGLRQAIKLLKVYEEAVFFFPSEIAFGYHGDNEKIGINKPIRAEVHILKITPSEKLEASKTSQEPSEGTN